MASFQARIGSKRIRKRENKNYRFVPSLPDALQKIPKKNCKKFKEIKKTPLLLHLKPEQVGKGRGRKKITIVVLFRSYPTRNRKFKKQNKKIQKNQKIPLWLHFKPPQVDGGCEKKCIKIILSFSSYLTHNRIIKKNSKKI